MSETDDLHALARAAGLRVDWTDVDGRPRRVTPPTLRAVLEALGRPARDARQCRDSLRRLGGAATPPPLPTVQAGAALELACGTPAQWVDEDGNACDAVRDAGGALHAPARPGYWTLLHGTQAQAVAVAPARCFSVADACGGTPARAWGLALQVYSARSEGDGGIGDAGGADDWVRRAALARADALALSPVHAARPIRTAYSPYSPSDRRFLDPLHAAPRRVLGRLAQDVLARDPGLSSALRQLQDAELIDWPRAAHAKGRWLRALHAAFGEAAPVLRDDLAAFRREAGPALADYAGFAAADFGDGDPGLHAFGQWLAARSWQGVQRDARERGMAIGLIADLAVGFDPHGAEAAAWPREVLRGVGLGAPPDAFNADGQAWNLATYSPDALRDAGYAPFLALLRAVMRDRGGIRIDHILGLQRLWLVPEGAGSGDGVYLDYPLHDLLNLLALESWRHRAVVIGEDLGVVPPGIRQALSARGVMGIDVLMFTRAADGAFLPPAQWRADAVATTTTHDLPTLVGWRQGVDIAWRERLGLSGPDDAPRRRQADLVALQRAIALAGLDTGHPWRDALAYAARGPAPLALLPVEDALALPEQPNLPGTVAGHPNWRRRLPDPVPAETLHAAVQAFAEARRLPLPEEATR
ncbi:4-alpha-glucanotransferase [Pseudomonas sp. Hp2]|uniref:4-alpha-glucanotransferase n=1 Tax=Pseudomonas sp. Hp2 TaxID=701189 RepID=UPI0011264312|nr:4-alpha-glucanotransferase [Pseudomonas sp. Hp2]